MSVPVSSCDGEWMILTIEREGNSHYVLRAEYLSESSIRWWDLLGQLCPTLAL